MFKDPREELLCDGEFLSAPILMVNHLGSDMFLNGLHGFLRLAVPLGLTSRGCLLHGPRLTPFFLATALNKSVINVSWSIVTLRLP